MAEIAADNQPEGVFRDLQTALTNAIVSPLIELAETYPSKGVITCLKDIAV